MRAYPQGHFPVFEQMNHMQFQIQNPQGFGAMLENIIETWRPARPAFFAAGIRKEKAMKYPIKKNTVQETLVIPMYGRKMCSQLYPKIYRDETALRLIDQVDYDFSRAGGKGQKHRCTASAFWRSPCGRATSRGRCATICDTHPNAAVVNLGCGLDDTGRACDNGTCQDL